MQHIQTYSSIDGCLLGGPGHVGGRKRENQRETGGEGDTETVAEKASPKPRCVKISDQHGTNYTDQVVEHDKQGSAVFKVRTSRSRDNNEYSLEGSGDHLNKVSFESREAHALNNERLELEYSSV